jgi:glycosyltransferase involved in cell wall biosynthesis
MKMAYVTSYDAADPLAWSGTSANILRALENCGLESRAIGNLRDRSSLLSKLKSVAYARLLAKTYLGGREPAFAEFYADQVDRALSATGCDIVFSPGTTPIAYLKTAKPTVFWADATFAGMVGFYPGYSNLCRESVRSGNQVEQAALSRCRLAIYCSDWAATTALENYDVDPGKVKVVPFGANIDCQRTESDIRSGLAGKEFGVCKLLFLGVEWFRKGGDVALKVAETLNHRGLQTELHVVGCQPPVAVPSFVKLHGFVSKTTDQGKRLLDQLMAEAHFLILPSRAECFGVVFAEASSFGVPSLAARVGGIPSAVRDGVNGQTFGVAAGHQPYCDYIESLMASRREYERLALSSFGEYSGRLNWSVAGRKVHDLVQEFCG